MTALPQRAERPLVELVLEVVSSGEVTLPPFPAMGQKLLALFRDEDHIDAIKVADLIYAEPAITATPPKHGRRNHLKFHALQGYVLRRARTHPNTRPAQPHPR